MTDEIEKLYQVVVEPSAFTEHPTIRGLSEFLMTQGLAGTTAALSELESVALGERPGEKRTSKTRIETSIDDSPRKKQHSQSEEAIPLLGEREWGGAIAVVGSAGRFPGSPNIEVFWDNLHHGRNLITPIPSDRWDINDYYSPDRDEARKSYSRWGGFMR